MKRSKYKVSTERINIRKGQKKAKEVKTEKTMQLIASNPKPGINDNQCSRIKSIRLLNGQYI